MWALVHSSARRETRRVNGTFGQLSKFVCAQALLAIPREGIFSHIVVGGAVFAIGIATIALRGDWHRARGFDKLILFGPVFYAAPLAAFGTEHFTITETISSLVPAWIPWHLFWTYFVGACFTAAGLSLATMIQARLAATLLGLNFFLFVVLMDAPSVAQDPRDRFALALMLRELSFSGGALALAASLYSSRTGDAPSACPRDDWTILHWHSGAVASTASLAIHAHGDHVPAIPLEMQTTYRGCLDMPCGTYLGGRWVHAVAGILLVRGKYGDGAAATRARRHRAGSLPVMSWWFTCRSP